MRTVILLDEGESEGEAIATGSDVRTSDSDSGKKFTTDCPIVD
jgi:hypothetical protein